MDGWFLGAEPQAMLRKKCQVPKAIRGSFLLPIGMGLRRLGTIQRAAYQGAGSHESS
jgi:hypothetical protein